MTPKPKSLLGKFLLWRAKHISQDRFVLMLSVLVGFITGLVAVILKNTTHFIQELVRSDYLDQYFNLYYFAFPRFMPSRAAADFYRFIKPMPI